MTTCILSLLLLGSLVINAYASAVLPVLTDTHRRVFYLDSPTQPFYLNLTCKQPNMLSISLTQQPQFHQAPRFNIYGNEAYPPPLGNPTAVAFQQCPVTISINSSSLIELRRSMDRQLLYVISEVTFDSKHNKIKVWDESTKWGLGERFQKNFAVTDGEWTIWNRDKPWKIDLGHTFKSDQTYGHQPVYLARNLKTHLYHMVYFKNTYGLTVSSHLNSNQLTYHSVGGQCQFVLLLGSKDPQLLLETFHDYIGPSHIPPFWSLGYHQSRWGYKSIADIRQVIDNYNAYRIPLDSIWSDLEYMDKMMIFTVNERTHPPQQLNELFKRHQLHFVPLLDVAISVHDRPAVKMGKQMGVFLKKNIAGQPVYEGQVWPGKVHYVDYLHANSTEFWKNQLDRLASKVNFSGIWLDMNEPVNFKGGEPTHETYRIQKVDNLNTMTIDVGLKHCSPNPQDSLLHRQVHSYYGHLSVLPTFQYLSISGRPFIITRSNSVGTGYFAGHWTGDNVASWEFLRASINGNFLFQIFGIQTVGADICGFYGDTTEELCSRWMQLGVFYPFARNHNHQDSVSQQPYQFSEMLLQTSLLSLRTRYSLLKQFYSWMVSKRGRGSFFRPLSFQFFADQECLQPDIIETQFLIGSSLMVTPIVQEGQTQVEVYFPGHAEQWFQFNIDSRTGRVQPFYIETYEGSSYQIIENELPAAPSVFLRGGHMIFTNKPQTRSSHLSNRFHLFATLVHGRSLGSIIGFRDYNKETDIKKCIKESCHFKAEITQKWHSQFLLEWRFEGSDRLIDQLYIDSIVFATHQERWTYNESIPVEGESGEIKIEAVLLDQ